MLRIEIQTPDALADVDHAGTVLAQVLRSIADRIESEVSITPTRPQGDEWRRETYRHAQRVDGILIGSVYELLAEA